MNYYWWEIMEMLRRVVLVGVLVLLGTGAHDFGKGFALLASEATLLFELCMCVRCLVLRGI